MTRKVLISGDFGAGWSTWADDNMRDDMLFDPQLIAALEARTHNPDAPSLGDPDDPSTPLGDFARRIEAKYGNTPYLGGASGLRVVEVEGQFQIDEYDGSESVVCRDDDIWI